MSSRFLVVLLLFFSSLGSSLGFAASPHTSRESQVRRPGETFAQALARYNAQFAHSPTLDSTSVESQAVPYASLDLTQIPAWPDESVLQDGFAAARDTRFIADPDHAGNLRRSSWLYPEDGCFARASMISSLLDKLGYPSPHKLFVFGNLQVATGNAPGGSVSWWYHVVPTISVGDENYVLDPAIEPSRPLTIVEWMKRMATDPTTLTLAICSEHSYSPDSPCAALPGDDSEAAADQADYLSAEWSGLIQLDRDPASELGSCPPWKSSC